MMPSDLDDNRVKIAHEISGDLIGTGVSVMGGGRKGPYTVIVNRVNLKDLRPLVDAIVKLRKKARA